MYAANADFTQGAWKKINPLSKSINTFILRTGVANYYSKVLDIWYFTRLYGILVLCPGVRDLIRY